MGGSTKQALLQALSAAEGAYISGQQLAEALGVSRAAVHKAAAGTFGPGIRAGSRPAPGLPAGRRRPLLRRSSGGLPRPHLPLRHAGKLQPARPSTLALGRRAPRHAGAHEPIRLAGRGLAGAAVRKPGREGRLPLPHPAARPCPAADAQSATISAAVAVGPGCQGPVWAGTGHQMGQRPLLSGP